MRALTQDGEMQALQPTDKDYWKHIVSANNSFGVELLKTIALAKPLDNIFISPTSIFLLMSMLYNGAAGDTYLQMAAGLKLPNPQEINPWNRQLINHLTSANFSHELLLASALWFGKGILCHDQFVNSCIESYSASLYGIDFESPEAPSQINFWAANATRGNIDQVVGENILGASLMVTNAIYFFARWTDQFDRSQSAAGPFHMAGGGTREAIFMSKTAQYEYFESEAFQVLKLPYANSPFFMQVILPKPGFHFGHCLPALAQPTMPMIPCELQLQMPRFTLEFEFEVKEFLPRLGIDNFNDFSLICPGLQVSNVLHKSKLKVDEEGTEAAAVTAAVGWGSAPRQALLMRVDRPFLLNIVDGGSGQILFSGAVVAPQS